MRKGLTLTLMTAAIALIGLQAMAMAPVIGEIPSPIVGNENSATNATTFVYPDAINLDSYVTDDPPTTPADVIWSYAEDTNTYQINGVAPLTATEQGNDSAILATGKRINGTTKDPADVDGKTNTITVRNVALTPISGSATRTPGADNADHVIASETKVVTLFASDGTTYSSKELMFYTDNGGNDRLSGQNTPGVGTPVFSSDFNGTTAGFGYTFQLGTVTSGTASSTALCLQTTAGGDNMAYWYSPFGTLPLVDNAVYHIRMKVNGSQTVANTVPLWDLVIINASEDGTKGKNLYGGDFIFFDNVGGANAAMSTGGRNDFDVWWCPSAISQTKFRDTATGPFSTGYANDKDARLQFRVLDTVANTAIHAEQALGSLCLDSLTIERFDLGSMTVESTPYNVTSITDSASGGNTRAEKLLNSTITFAGGTVTIQCDPTTEYASVTPGDATINTSQGSTLLDNWPVPIVTDGIYQVVYGLSAPTAADVTNSPDVFWVGGDEPSQEVIQTSFVTNWLASAAMPQATGAAQDYIMFYAANAVSKDPTPEFKYMRPRLNIGTNESLVQGNNSGKITVHSVKVNKVSFQ